MLDFVFVAGAARQWRASSEILEAHEAYCPDNNARSDHRPLLAHFELGSDSQPSTRDQVLGHVQRLEEELRALKALVEALPS